MHVLLLMKSLSIIMQLLGIPWHDSDEGPKINQYGNLALDRYHALEFFQNFRKAGIRSHFWP